MSQHFRNNPNFSNSEAGMVKRYSHQPLTIEHYGIHAKIQENGKVLISSAGVKGIDGVIEYDEVEIPASLVFKLANLLKDTRIVRFVKINEAVDVVDD
jgi:hypothetical protein